MLKGPNSNDRTRIELCFTKPATFTYAPHGGTHPTLIRSSCSPSQRAHLERLALAGYLAKSVVTPGAHFDPPEHTVMFKVTALGREAIDIFRPVKPLVNFQRSKTNAELLAEANVRD